MPAPARLSDRLSPRTLLLGFFTLFCMLLLLRNASLATAAMQKGLSLCAQTLIPSLFPFMVLSELLRTSPLARALTALLSRPLCRLLHLGEAAGSALILGILCGAPVGAQSLVRALDEGEVTQEECERVLGITTVPSSAFLIGVIGERLLGSPAFGNLLLLSVLLSSLIASLLFARGKNLPVRARPMRKREVRATRAFTDAVRLSAQTMLTVCAFVLFFSVLSGALDLILAPLPETLRTSVSVLLELSEGARRACALPQKIPAACLSAFAAGWAGLSIHFQILSICDGRGLSFVRYFLCKATEGILCAILVLVGLALFPALL